MATKETPNLRNVMAFVANRPATAPEAAPAAAPEPVSQPAPPATEEAAKETPVLKLDAPTAGSEPKQKGKKARTAAEESPQHTEYTEAFLVPVRGRKPKTIYVDESTHEALSVLAHSVDGVGLSDLIINIVNHHFETYGKDIRGFLDSIENQKKRRLPY